MTDHQKKGRSTILILALFMIMFLFFAGIFYKEKDLKIQIGHEISLLPSDYDKYCRPELKEDIKNFENGIVTYISLQRTLTDLKEFNTKHMLQLNYPSVHIYSKDESGNNLKNYSGKKQMSVVIIDAKGYAIKDDDVTVNVRGNSTSAGEKAPYNLKLSTKKQVLDLGKNKKWSLLAECFDPTLIRNYLFFDLAKTMELEYTPDAEYVRVYMDDQYKGCYLLTERADIAVDRVNITPALGEFLFEYQEDREDDDVKYVVTPSGWRFEIKDPDDPGEDLFAYMEEVLNSFDSAIVSNDYDRLTSVIDIDSFAKYYLLNELAKPIDFDYSSVKFYLKDGLIYAGPVWDYDISSGNYDPDFYSIAWYGKTPEEKKQNNISYYGIYCDRNPVFKALLEYKEFRGLVSQYFDQYTDAFEDLYIEGGKIDQIVKENYDLFLSNYSPIETGGAGWQVDHKYSGLEGNRLPTYEQNLDYLKTWLKNRYEWLRDNDPWK